MLAVRHRTRPSARARHARGNVLRAYGGSSRSCCTPSTSSISLRAAASVGRVHDLRRRPGSSRACPARRCESAAGRGTLTSPFAELDRLGAQHQVREVDVPRMRRHVRALRSCSRCRRGSTGRRPCRSRYLVTPSTSQRLDLRRSRSNSVGKAPHRLTQRRQPWQMSKTRSSSRLDRRLVVELRRAASRAGGAWAPRGCPLARSWSLGRPSPARERRQGQGPGPQDVSVGQGVERLLEAVGVRALGLRPASRTSRRSRRSSPSRAAFAMPGYMSVYSCVSPATAAFRFSRARADRQVGRRVAHLARGSRGGRARGRSRLRRWSGTAPATSFWPSTSALLGEVEVAAVRHRLARERVLQVLVGLGAFRSFMWLSSKILRRAHFGRRAGYVQLIVPINMIILTNGVDNQSMRS